MAIKKRSFFERLTGSVKLDDELEDEIEETKTPDTTSGVSKQISVKTKKDSKEPVWSEEEKEEEGQLSVDVYQTPTDIVVQTMVAGVRPEDLQINITRDMLTIRGKREPNRTIDESNYFTRELYWGAFSRTISLPQEIEPEEAEAIEKHGLLMIRMPKIDKNKQTTLKIKTI
jgi:HSP20 family protein